MARLWWRWMFIRFSNSTDLCYDWFSICWGKFFDWLLNCCNSDWLLLEPTIDNTRLRKLWKLIGKGVLNFFGSRFFDRRKDKLIFDDNNQKTQWEKDFKLLAPENWTNGRIRTSVIFFIKKRKMAGHEIKRKIQNI